MKRVSILLLFSWVMINIHGVFIINNNNVGYNEEKSPPYFLTQTPEFFVYKIFKILTLKRIEFLSNQF